MGIRAHLITGFKQCESFSLFGNKVLEDAFFDLGKYDMFSEDGDCGLILVESSDCEIMKKWYSKNESGNSYDQEDIIEFQEIIAQIEKDIAESHDKTGVAIARYYVF